MYSEILDSDKFLYGVRVLGNPIMAPKGGHIGFD